MKKILILNGAGKQNGNTSALIKAFTEGAESSGNEVKEFYLKRLPRRCFRRVQPHPDFFRQDSLHPVEFPDLFLCCRADVFPSAVGAGRRKQRITECIMAAFTCTDLHIAFLLSYAASAGVSVISLT